MSYLLTCQLHFIVGREIICALQHTHMEIVYAGGGGKGVWEGVDGSYGINIW